MFKFVIGVALLLTATPKVACGADFGTPVPNPHQLVLVPNPKVKVVPQSRSDFHSHTCANGHTWSHSSSDPNASHTCPVCGLSQYVVDQTKTYQVPRLTYDPFRSGTPGCVGGNCPAPSAPQIRLFPFRR